MPKPVVVTTIRIDPALYEAAQKAASAAGVSLNAWVAEAIQEKAKKARPT